MAFDSLDIDKELNALPARSVSNRKEETTPDNVQEKIANALELIADVMIVQAKQRSLEMQKSRDAAYKKK